MSEQAQLWAPDPPADADQEYIDGIAHSSSCWCSRKKNFGALVCATCYLALTPQMQYRLHRRKRIEYEAAVSVLRSSGVRPPASRHTPDLSGYPD